MIEFLFYTGVTMWVVGGVMMAVGIGKILAKF